MRVTCIGRFAEIDIPEHGLGATLYPYGWPCVKAYYHGENKPLIEALEKQGGMHESMSVALREIPLDVESLSRKINSKKECTIKEALKC